jgi:hypothetical protein
MMHRTPGETARRRLLPVCAALLLFLFPSPCRPGAGIGAEEGIAARRGRARTVAELARLYDSRHCRDCHVEIYRDWEKSVHSRPLFGTGRTALTLITTITNGLMKWSWSGVKSPGDVKVEHLMGCARCHLPQLADATDDVAREIVADLLKWQAAKRGNDPRTVGAVEAKLKGLSVGCLICHNRNAVLHKWADGYPGKREVFGSRGGTHFCGLFPVLKKSPVMGESILCGQCHGLGPNFGLDNPTQCATVYGNYLFSYRAGVGKESCQDCHMRKSRLGHNIQSYRDPAMVRAAVDFSASVRRVPGDGGAGTAPGSASRIAVDVSMTNRAGHSIPDG